MTLSCRSVKLSMPPSWRNFSPFPSTPDQWRDIAKLFGQRWNFHHCCGALNGKHIEIKTPEKSGSIYYSYEGFFSMILPALVDADYQFIWCKIGGPGSASDAGVFNKSRFRPALESKKLVAGCVCLDYA